MANPGPLDSPQTVFLSPKMSLSFLQRNGERSPKGTEVKLGNRRITAGAAALAVAASLVACSPRAEEPSDDGSLSGDVRFTVWYGGEMWEGIAEEFEKQNPDVDVTVQEVSWDQYYTKLNTEFASGNAPDVFGMQFQASQWGHAGILAPMTDDVADVIDSVPESLTQWGRAADAEGAEQQFALPFTFVGRTLYGNVTAMTEAGVAIPDEWTLDDLVAAAQALTTPDRFGLQVQNGSGEAAIASTFGASPLSEDGKTATYDTPEMLAHKSFLRDLIYKYKVSPAPDQLSTQQDPFTSGQVAMVFAGSWMIPSYREQAKFDWDILPNPSGELDAKNYAGPDNIGVYAKSKNLAAAKAFAKFAAFNSDAQTVVSEAGSWPVLTDLFLDEGLISEQAALKPANIEYALVQSTQNATGWGFSPAFAEIEKLEVDANYAIFSDPNSDIEGILAQLNTDVQTAIDKVDQ